MRKIEDFVQKEFRTIIIVIAALIGFVFCWMHVQQHTLYSYTFEEDNGLYMLSSMGIKNNDLEKFSEFLIDEDLLDASHYPLEITVDKDQLDIRSAGNLSLFLGHDSIEEIFILKENDHTKLSSSGP